MEKLFFLITILLLSSKVRIYAFKTFKLAFTLIIRNFLFFLFIKFYNVLNFLSKCRNNKKHENKHTNTHVKILPNTLDISKTYIIIIYFGFKMLIKKF